MANDINSHMGIFGALYWAASFSLCGTLLDTGQGQQMICFPQKPTLH